MNTIVEISRIQNAASALAALDALELPRPQSVDVDFARWRGEEHELPGGGLLINDAYNANPVSMRAALAYLAERAGDRRRVAILGEMADAMILASAHVAPRRLAEDGYRFHHPDLGPALRGLLGR